MHPRSTGKPVFDLVGKVDYVPVALRTLCRSIMGMVPKKMLLNLAMGPPMNACRLRPVTFGKLLTFNPLKNGLEYLTMP